MGHNVTLTIHDNSDHSKTSLEFIKILNDHDNMYVENFETTDDFGKKYKNNSDVKYPFKTKIDIRVTGELKNHYLIATRIICNLLFKWNIINFKIEN